jgi:hypothetical protein
MSRRRQLEDGTFGRAKYHPTLGWALLPGLKEVQVPGTYSVSTNSRGVRGGIEHSYAKDPAIKRIVTIGDSFTFGDEVSDGETYPTQLAAMWPGAEVINLGVNGYGHDQMLLSFQAEGGKYSPDIVVLGFVESDMSRNLLRMMHYPKPKYEVELGQLQLKNVPVPTFRELYEEEPYRSKIVDVLNIIYDSLKLKCFRSAYIEERERITGSLLTELVREIRARGATPVFVYIFTPKAVAKIRTGPRPSSELFFHDFCRSQQITCASTRTYFEEALGRGDTLKRDGHWDAEGNKVIAQAVYEASR